MKENKDKIIRFRVTEDQAKQLKQMSMEEGKTLSDCIRSALRLYFVKSSWTSTPVIVRNEKGKTLRVYMDESRQLVFPLALAVEELNELGWEIERERNIERVHKDEKKA